MADAVEAYRALAGARPAARARFEERARDRVHRLELLRTTSRNSTHWTPSPARRRAWPRNARASSNLGRLAEGTHAGDGRCSTDEDRRARGDRALRNPARHSRPSTPRLVRRRQLLDEAGSPPRGAREPAPSLESLEADPARQEWVEARLAALESSRAQAPRRGRRAAALRERSRAELQSLGDPAVSTAELDARGRRGARAPTIAPRGTLSARGARRPAARREGHGSSCRASAWRAGSFETRVEPRGPPARRARQRRDRIPGERQSGPAAAAARAGRLRR